MEQIKTATFKSADNKIVLTCDADTSLGVIHDFLLHIKGDIVNRILEAQKQQEAEVEQKQVETSSEEVVEETK